MSFLVEPAAVVAAAGGAAVASPPPAAPAPAAVLVMVDGGQYRELDGVATGAVLAMSVTRLLRALQKDGIFAKAVAGMLLDRCTVIVAASASKRAPSAAEMAAHCKLQGAVTLGELAAEELATTAAVAGGKPYNLYVHVSPQASLAGAAGGSGGEEPLGGVPGVRGAEAAANAGAGGEAGAGGFVPRAEFDRVVAALTKEQRLARALRLLPPVAPASQSSPSRSGELSPSRKRGQQSVLKAKAVMYYYGVTEPPPAGKAYTMLGDVDVDEHSHCTLAHIYPKGALHTHELAQQLCLKPDFLTDPRCCLLLPKVVEVAMDREAVVLAPQRGGVITVRPVRMELLSPEEQARVAPYLNKTLEWPKRTAAPACLPFMRLLAWRCVSVLSASRLPPAAPWADTDAVAAVREAAMNASLSAEGTAGLAELAGAFE